MTSVASWMSCQKCTISLSWFWTVTDILYPQERIEVWLYSQVQFPKPLHKLPIHKDWGFTFQMLERNFICNFGARFSVLVWLSLAQKDGGYAATLSSLLYLPFLGQGSRAFPSNMQMASAAILIILTATKAVHNSSNTACLVLYLLPPTQA